MFGMERVIGMRGVFQRLLGVIVMNLFLVRLFIEFRCGRLIEGGGNRCLDRGRNRRLGLLRAAGASTGAWSWPSS